MRIEFRCDMKLRWLWFTLRVAIQVFETVPIVSTLSVEGKIL